MSATLPLPLETGGTPAQPPAPPRLREIPYNYTSLADREIVIRLLGAKGLLARPAAELAD